MLSKLDVSKCPRLWSLCCSKNKLAKLDVSRCTKLVDLDCEKNKLTGLDVSKCAKLSYLDCSNNKIARLTLGKGEGDFGWLDYSGNPLGQPVSTQGDVLRAATVSI